MNQFDRLRHPQQCSDQTQKPVLPLLFTMDHYKQSQFQLSPSIEYTHFLQIQHQPNQYAKSKSWGHYSHKYCSDAIGFHLLR